MTKHFYTRILEKFFLAIAGTSSRQAGTTWFFKCASANIDSFISVVTNYYKKQNHKKPSCVLAFQDFFDKKLIRKRSVQRQIATFSSCLFFLLTGFFAKAQSISVNSLSGSPLCPGSNITINFKTTNGNNASTRFTNSTVYTVYLSTSSGGTPYTSIGTFSTSGVSYSGSNNGVTNGITQVFTIPATTAAGGSYKIALGSTSPTFNGSGGSGAAGTLVVNALPSFTSQPSTSTQSICLNGTATALSVVASAGSGSISGYQWYKNASASNSGGTLIAGATSTSYTPLTSVAGTLYYYCVVTNSNGCTKASNVSGAITINAPPSFTVQPSTSTQSLCLNSTATALSVTASAGSGSISGYQWYKNAAASNSGGTLIAGATSSSYTALTSVAGILYYYCIVTNSNGCTVTSNISGSITVNALPSITGQPSTSTQNLCLNAAATALSITASAGSGSISGYQWYSNSTASNSGGTLIAGAISSSYTPLTAAAGALYYYCIVTNSNGCSTTSNISGAVIVTGFPTITAQPSTVTQSLCLNAAATTLSVTASGISLTYQWYSNTAASNTGGTLIPAATAATYTPSTTVAGTLYYYCIVSGTCSLSVNSNISGAVTTIAIPVTPGSITGSATFCAGSFGNVYSIAAVPGATSYTWSYSGTGATITNGTTTTATIDFSLAATSGTLSVTANNTCGSSAASTLVLTVNAITGQPANDVSNPGGPTSTFSVSASGIITSYQWQYSANGTTGWASVSNGSPTGITYANSTTADLDITPGLSTVFGLYYYRCIVTTSSCSFTSNNATLIISDINDLCANAIPLIINGPAISGSLINSTFNAPFGSNDVWYKITPSCTVNHSITISGFSGSGGNVDWEIYNSAGCPVSTSYLDQSNSASDPETKSTSLVSGTTYYIRVIAFNPAANSSNFNIAVTSNAPTFTLDNTGTPAAGNVLVNSANVSLFGFTLTPVGCSATFNFTGLAITATGTANATDLSNFQIIYDANNNGVKDLGESSISGAGKNWSPTLSFAITGQTGLSSARRFLLIADVALGATNNRTFSGNLASGGVSAGVAVTGGAAGNLQTIKSPLVTITAIHPAAGTIDQNTTNNILATFKLDASFNTVIPTGITVTTAGTYIPTTDITRFSLYQNNANNTISPTLIATITTFGAAPATLVFSGTGTPITAGSTQYLFVTADVPLSGTDLNTVNITATALSNFSFTGASGETVVKAGTDPATIGPVKTINGPRINILQVHPAAGNITQGTTDNQIATYQLNVTNLSTGFVNIQSVSLKTAGTYVAGDITSFNLWQNSANTLTGATLAGTISASSFASGQTLTFNSGFLQIANAGYSYLMLTANVNSTATLGKTLSITTTNFTNLSFISSWGSKVAKLGTDPVPASNTQTIVGPIAAISTAHPLAGNMLVGSTDNLLAAFKVIVSNADVMPTLVKLVTSSGTYSGSTDILKFKLYQNDANSLTSATLVGTISATVSSSQTLIFNTGFTSIPAGTTGYLMLCADLTGSATSTKNISVTATPIGNFNFSSTGPVVVTGSASLSASTNQTIVPKLDVYSSNTKNWDNTTSNWGQNANGSGGGYANSVWITNGYAQLEGTAGQVTITTPVIADKLISLVNNYKVDASSATNGVTLTSPSIINISSGTSFTGNSSTNPVIYGVNGFTKTGTGELQIGSDLASTFSGTIYVNGGTLTLGKKAGGYNPLTTLESNPIEIDNARLTIATSSGSSGSIQNFASLSATGADTIGLYSTGSGVYLNVTPVTNTSTFGTSNGVPLTINGSLKVDNGGSANTKGAFANATNQNFIAFGNVKYNGNATFEAWANNASLKKRTGDIININLGGYGHYITGVAVASGTIDDNGYTSTFLGGGGIASDGGAICLNAAASTMTGNWVIGDGAGINAAWVVTNTSTCLTTGSITINNYSKLNLQLSTPGNSTITYSPSVINVYGLGPYSKTNSYTFGSALDFYDFARATDTITLPTNITLNPVYNSKLAAIGVMIGDDSTSSSSGSLAAFQLNGTVSGTGGLEKTGPGILILNAQNGSGFFNTYSDSTRIIRGTLTINTGSNLGTGPVLMSQITKNSTALNFYNTSQTISSLATQWADNSGQSQVVTLNGTTLTVNQNVSTTFGNGTGTSTGYIKGTGNLIKDGSGTLTLTGVNIYTGLTQVKGGTLELKNSAATTLPTTNSVDIVGGTLLLSANQTLNNVTLSTGNLTLAANTTLTITGTLTMAASPANITLGANAKIVYGANATLVYAGSSLQQTSVNDKEFPTANPPTNITFSNFSTAGVQWSNNISVAGVTTVAGWVDMNGKTISGAGSFVLNGFLGGPLSSKTVSGSPIVSSVNTNNVRIGMTVTGTGIPANTTVIYIDPLNSKTVTLNNNATVTGTNSLTFGFRGGLIVSLPGGIDAHITVSGTKTYNSGANYIFKTPVSGTTIFPAFPTVGTLSYSPAYDVTIVAGKNNKVIMNTSSASLTVSNNLSLTSGIWVTNDNLITWSNSGGVLTAPNTPWTTGSSTHNDSYICTCTSSGNPITSTGSNGFRINSVTGNTDVYFPIGVDFVSSNRMALNMNNSATSNFTVVLGKGDLLNTPQSRVNRIWYVTSSGTGVKASMKLYFTKRNWSTNPFLSAQDEIETGYLYNDNHLIQRAYTGAFLNTSATADLVNFIGNADNTEIYGMYNYNVSSDYSGAKNGINIFSRFSIVNGNSIILPVSIIDFKAAQQGSGIHVQWKVLNELNIDHYEIQKSLNGVAFSTIASVQALNNDMPVNQYAILDGKPVTGNNFYRIKTVDKNNSITYTEVIDVKISAGISSSSIRFYPNPVTSHAFNIQLNNLAAGRYNVSLYNAAGQKVLDRVFDHAGNAATQQIMLPATVTTGTYLVKLFNETTYITTKIIVQ